MLRILAAWAAVLIAVAGCSWLAPGPAAPSASLDPHRPLVTVETRGGECAFGECREIVRIDADGSSHRLQPHPELVRAVPAELVDALAIEMDRANFPLIESRPFRSTCPTAYDGQETIYTFHLLDGDEAIASCHVAIDPADPLFRAVNAVLTPEGR